MRLTARPDAWYVNLIDGNPHSTKTIFHDRYRHWGVFVHRLHSPIKLLNSFGCSKRASSHEQNKMTSFFHCSNASYTVKRQEDILWNNAQHTRQKNKESADTATEERRKCSQRQWGLNRGLVVWRTSVLTAELLHHSCYYAEPTNPRRINVSAEQKNI